MKKSLTESLGILPPQNTEAERALLGSIFLDNKSIYKIVDLVKPEDFYRKENGLIFEAMLKLFEKGSPIDVITVEDELKDMKVYDEVGGREYLISLLDIVPTAAHIEQYAQIVKEKAILREIISVSTEIIRRCYEEDVSVNELLDEAERMIFSISEKRTQTDFAKSKDLVKSAVAQLEQLMHKKQLITGIPTGFIDFDRVTAGLQPGDLIIIAARPGMGKTAFALNIALNVAVNEGEPVAIFSLEMPKEQIALRLISTQSMVDYQKLRTGNITPEEWIKITKAADVLTEAPIFVDDTPAISVLEMRAKARRLQSEYGLKLLIVDYLQLMRGKRRMENRQQEISEISRALKELAKELNIPVVAISQLSRAVEARQDKRPQLSDLRESGAIEQDADLVVFIYREELYRRTTENTNVAEIIIGKQRNGPMGITIKLTFLKECLRFESYEERSDFIDDLGV